MAVPVIRSTTVIPQKSRRPLVYASSALGPSAGYGWYTADKDEPICDTVSRLGKLPFVAQPGEAWVYGYSLDVLGCVVERASGTALDQFVRERISQPLGMKDTTFYLPRDQRDRLAVVYTRDADGHIVRADEGAKGQGHYVEGPRRSFAGGAGLLSTARDYSRFLEMIRNGGALEGVRVLNTRTVRLMTMNQSADCTRRLASASASALRPPTGLAPKDSPAAAPSDGAGHTARHIWSIRSRT